MVKGMWTAVLVVVAAGAGVMYGAARPAAAGAKAPPSYVDPEYGFSISAPAFAPSEGGVRVVFYGPIEHQFGNNVNVLVQPEKATLAEYRATSEKEMEQAGFKVNSVKELKVSGADALLMDYQGTPPGQAECHFLSLAVMRDNKVILATCTSRAEDYASHEQEYQDCLKSMKFGGGGHTER